MKTVNECVHSKKFLCLRDHSDDGLGDSGFSGHMGCLIQLRQTTFFWLRPSWDDVSLEEAAAADLDLADGSDAALSPLPATGPTCLEQGNGRLGWELRDQKRRTVVASQLLLS